MAFAGVIAALAIPRLTTALILMPGSAAIEVMRSGQMPDQPGIMRAVAAETGAVRILPRPETYLDLAFLTSSLAEAGDLDPANHSALRGAARQYLERALGTAPGEPRGWLMLAALRAESGDDAAAARALAVSYATNPHWPAIAPARWRIALRLGGRLSKEVREQAGIEFLSYFRLQPLDAVRLALGAGALAELSALASDRGIDRTRFHNVLDRMQFGGEAG